MWLAAPSSIGVPPAHWRPAAARGAVPTPKPLAGRMPSGLLLPRGVRGGAKPLPQRRNRPQAIAVPTRAALPLCLPLVTPVAGFVVVSVSILGILISSIVNSSLRFRHFFRDHGSNPSCSLSVE